MAQLTFGYESIGLQIRSIKDDIGIGYFQMGPTNGTLNSLRAYLSLSINTGTVNVKAAIYDSNKSLLGESTARSYSSSTAGWQNFTFSSSISLTANAYYYLAVWSNTGV